MAPVIAVGDQISLFFFGSSVARNMIMRRIFFDFVVYSTINFYCRIYLYIIMSWLKSDKRRWLSFI